MLAVSALSAALADGVTVVSATRRLARYLLEQHAAAQRAGGYAVWSTPHVYSWEDWLRESWHRVGRRRPSAPILLSEVQTMSWWESVIADAEGGTPTSALLNVPATARAARAAWRLMNGWALSLNELDPAGNADAAAFLKWARVFEQSCRDRGWIDADSLGGALFDLLARGDWQPGPVLFFGFDALTPIQRRIAGAIGARTMTHEQRPHVSARSIACDGGMSELDYAARWSGQLIGADCAGPIGIVVPDLFGIQDDVARAFDQAFHFDLDICHAVSAVRPYHISTGRPLSEYPVIDAALLVLRFMRGLHSSSELGRLLRSPFYFGGETEVAARSLVDEQLRRRGIADMTPRGLLSWLNRGGAQAGESCPLLKQSLQTAIAIAVPVRQSPFAWVGSFSEWLRALGWPGDRALDSAEYQTVVAWNDLLASFASLSLFAGEFSRREALDKLAGVARDRVYQPRAHPAAVHIMTPAESAGMQFQSLWVMGMSEVQWPRPVQPNPFLPVALQRRLRMPGADPGEVLAHARRVRARWLDSAAHLVVSYPTLRDEQPVGVSALFADLAPVTADVLGVTGLTYAEQMSRTRLPLSEQSDPTGPALADLRLARGGAGVFRDQAACPFRAFARYRLGVRLIPEVEPGLDAKDRGNLVHQCLTELWRAVQSRAGLVAMDAPKFREFLRQLVDAVIGRVPPRGGKRFHSALMVLERSRLVALLEEWAERERERGDFVVSECEREIVASISGLPVHMRIDRIDRLPDGSLFVIDYKTGVPQKPAQWFGSRPDDPQLPAYVIGLGEPVSAIAFAEVSRGACRWTGLSDAGSPAPGVVPIDAAGIPGSESWPQAIQTWHEVLARLAQEFRSGDARVAPKRDDTCRYCEVGPLCRIGEHRQQTADAGGATNAA